MKIPHPSRSWCIFLLVLTVFRLHGAVRLPAIFSDHMVLQRDSIVPVWGWAEPGEHVTVEIAGQRKSCVTNTNGVWKVKLDELSISSPTTMTVTGSNAIKVEDVLMGEVWLASGQSNMQLPVRLCDNYEQERAAATFPKIRMFQVPKEAADTPQSDCGGKWIVCSPGPVGGFAGTAYFFGRALFQSLNVPIGMIDSSLGGTAIEGWTSLDRQTNQPELAPLLATWREKTNVVYNEAEAVARYEKEMVAWKKATAAAKAAGKDGPATLQKPGPPRLDKNFPGNLFNAMIAPIIPYAIRGAIWYQGENNAWYSTVKRYDVQLPLLISDWRQRWEQGAFPFAWVQLPNYRKRTDDPGALSAWALMRESMLHSLSVITNSGMAVTIDVGSADTIHPPNKQEVGRRLSLWALARVYGTNVPFSGPLFDSQVIKSNTVSISFKYTYNGLATKNGEPLKGFAIAAKDGKWVWADAQIRGDQVLVSSPAVVSPVAVRYGWADNPDCNLINSAGLPASPFRTDDPP